MEYELSILSTEEDYEDVREAIEAFLQTYGDCEVRLYERGAVIEESGLAIHGEFGTLDALFSPIRDARLKRSDSFDDGRSWLEWNAVIFSLED